MQCIISCDLRKPGQDYESLYWLLERIGARRAQQSVWFYGGPLVPEQIRDILIRAMDSNDDLLVVECGGRWATLNSWAARAWLTSRDALGRLLSRLRR